MSAVLVMILAVVLVIVFVQRSHLPSSCKSRDVHVMAVATNEAARLDNFKRSAVNLGYACSILGMGYKWNGVLDKFVHLQKKLRVTPPYEVVCFTDAYDVLFCRHLKPPFRVK